MDLRTTTWKKLLRAHTVSAAFCQALSWHIATHGTCGQKLKRIGPRRSQRRRRSVHRGPARSRHMELRTTIQNKWHLALTVKKAFRQPLPRHITINGPAGGNWKEMPPAPTVMTAFRQLWPCKIATNGPADRPLKRNAPALTETTAFRQRWLWQTGAQPRESTRRPTPTRPVHRCKRHHPKA